MTIALADIQSDVEAPLRWTMSRFAAGPIRRKEAGTWVATWGPTTRPSPIALDWAALVSLLTTWRHYPRPTVFPDLDGKLALDCWSPAVYPPECRRRKKVRVASISALVLDFDDGTRMEDAVVVYQDFDHIGHTSWSHTEDHHRFRIVLPLAEPVPGPEWARAWRWVLRDWQERSPRQDAGALVGRPDTACKDASRLYFLPAIRPGAPRYAWSHLGYYGLLSIPWHTLPADAAPRLITPLRPIAVSSDRMEREIKARLNTEPAARRDLGHVLDGVVTGELVRHVRCPQCGKRSVWWPIQPTHRKTALCNHRKTCGWWGFLFDLALLSGLAVETQAA